jgi:hypothetical protein
MKQAIKIGSYIFNLVDTCSLDINKHYKKDWKSMKGNELRRRKKCFGITV